MILFLPFILHCDNAEDVFPDIFGFSSEPFVLLTVVGEKKKKVHEYVQSHGHTAETRSCRHLFSNQSYQRTDKTCRPEDV